MTDVRTGTGDLKAAIEESLELLAQAVDEQASSDDMHRHLDLMARFPRYSWGNCWLIAQARPDATLVAGFSQWKRLGRSVKAGEKAIRILAPCPIRREKPETGDEEERVFFKAACVFDVAQTQGKDLEQYEVPDLLSGADELLGRLETVARTRGIALEYVQLREGHYGSSMGGRIEIATGHSTGQQAKSLAHEIAHEALHQRHDGEIDSEQRRDVRELEAEAVAYVVCRHFGLDAEVRASRYIALWGGDAKALRKSLSRISNTARKMIEDVEKLEDALVSDSPVAGDTLMAA